MQKALWGQNPMRLTQGENTAGKDASHKKSLALDAGGKNTAAAGSVDNFYAPWDGKVVRADGSSNNAMYIESTNAVLAPNGTIAVQRLVLIHTNKYLLAAGQTFKQGEHIYTEGTKGGVQAHIHIEGGFGSWASVGGAKLAKNNAGTWCILSQAHLYDMLFVPDDFAIQDGKGYAWKHAGAALETNTTDKEDIEMILKVCAPVAQTPRSSLIAEGCIQVKGVDGAMKLYNPAASRYAREVAEDMSNLSPAYEDCVAQMQPGEILLGVE